MCHKWLVLLMSILCVQALYANAIDSLKNVAIKNDTQSIMVNYQLADAHRLKGNLNQALNYGNEALRLSEKMQWSSGISKSANIIAYINIYQSDFENALKYALLGLENAELDNNKVEQAFSYLYIGYVYMSLKEYETAKSYYLKSIDIRKPLKVPHDLAFSYTYLANLYSEQNHYDSSLYYHEKALALRKRTKSLRNIADSYHLIGGIHLKTSDYKNAMQFSINALDIYLETNDSKRLGETYRQLAEIKMMINELNEAEYYLLEALKFSKESSAFDNVALIYEILSSLYERQGNYAESNKYLNRHYELKDKIAGERIFHEASKMLIKYKVNREQRIQELMVQKDELKKKIFAYILYSGILILLIIVGFVLYRLRVTKKQNQAIEQKNNEIQSKNQAIAMAHDQLKIQHNEITDSIAYAKRIQSAILPPVKLLKNQFTDSFVFYKPKDVVAGDFYWLYTKPEENLVLFAAADCTGHGVPGAMVSVICNSALNRAVKEFGLREPGAILTKTRELVTEEFEKSDEDVKDGMDIALCSLHTSSLTLKYSGAYNPLWIIRKEHQEVEEIKAHKQAIGLVESPIPFPTHQIKMNKGDTFYIFTDGFADQFGGEKGKKFKAPNFRRLLLNMQEKSLQKQHDLIDHTFESWKGDLEQIDDVCIIGIRV